MLKFGTKTKFGEIADITNKGEDLYYVIVDGVEVVLIPVDVVEESLKEKK